MHLINQTSIEECTQKPRARFKHHTSAPAASEFLQDFCQIDRTLAARFENLSPQLPQSTLPGIITKSRHADQNRSLTDRLCELANGRNAFPRRIDNDAQSSSRASRASCQQRIIRANRS